MAERYLGKEATSRSVVEEGRTFVCQAGVGFFSYEYRKSWSNLIRTIT